jgi:hypothetical protein
MISACFYVLGIGFNISFVSLKFHRNGLPFAIISYD